MMRLFGRVERKENPVGAALVTGPVSSWNRNTDPRAFITEGYQANVIVYRAIREIVRAASALEIEVHQGDKVLEEHPVIDLLREPNPRQTWDQFIDECLTNRMLFGEVFAVGHAGPRFAEIWPLLPLHMEVKPGGGGLPAEYCHELNGKKHYFPVDRVSGMSDVMFLRLYNPDNYWRGQSPLMASALAGDTFNAGSKWNYSLLKNSARPSGIVRFKGAYPGQEQVARLREYFKKSMAGERNAGEIPMLSEDAEWQQIDQSPRDMDFLNTMKEAAKYVSSAMGVPLPLIDNDASTFNNLEQAKERLYTDTVLPIMDEFLQALGKWLLPRWGDDLKLAIDHDKIPALEGLRQRKFERAAMAYEKGLLTREESREMLGFDPEGQGEYRQQPAPAVETRSALLHKLAYG